MRLSDDILLRGRLLRAFAATHRDQVRIRHQKQREENEIRHHTIVENHESPYAVWPDMIRSSDTVRI